LQAPDRFGGLNIALADTPVSTAGQAVRAAGTAWPLLWRVTYYG